MLNEYKTINQNLLSKELSARTTGLYILTSVFSLIVTFMAIFLLISNSSDHQWQDPSKCIRQTNTWILQFSTSANVSFARNVTSVNIDVLGLSIDRLIQASSHSTVVFRADLTWENFDSKVIKTISEKDALVKGQLKVELQFQYPEHCCGDSRCEDAFKLQVWRQFNDQSVQRLAIQSTDGMDTFLKVRLEKVVAADGNPLPRI